MKELEKGGRGMRIYKTQEEVNKDLDANGNLVVKDDIKFACDVKIEGDIDALEITASEIDAWNIDALEITARKITARKIDTGNIYTGNIDAWEITARKITARNIEIKEKGAGV